MVKIACYKPLIRIEDLTRWEISKSDGHKYHPAKIVGCSDDVISNELFITQDGTGINKKYQLIQCGKCIGCRLDYSRDWATRGYLEMMNSKNNYFVTLTYDNEHLPVPKQMTIEKTGEIITEWDMKRFGIDWNGTLVKKDIEQFMDTLRHKMARDPYNHRGIRYCLCGEYGELNRRPHYHIILFNCPLPIESFYCPRLKWEEAIYYQNTIIEECWTKGISNITQCSWNTIAYVARYITKKQYGEHSQEHYARLGQIPEFMQMSLKPAIGWYYYEQHKDKIYEQDSIIIKNRTGIQAVKPPKYFDKLYEKENPKHMEEIKAKRRVETIRNLKTKAQTTSLSQWEQLEVELHAKEQQTAIFHRNNEEL